MKIWVRRETDGFSHTGCVREFRSLKECMDTLAKETGATDFYLRNRYPHEEWIPADVAHVVEICDSHE